MFVVDLFKASREKEWYFLECKAELLIASYITYLESKVYFAVLNLWPQGSSSPLLY